MLIEMQLPAKLRTPSKSCDHCETPAATLARRTRYVVNRAVTAVGLRTPSKFKQLPLQIPSNVNDTQLLACDTPSNTDNNKTNCLQTLADTLHASPLLYFQGWLLRLSHHWLLLNFQGWPCLNDGHAWMIKEANFEPLPNAGKTPYGWRNSVPYEWVGIADDQMNWIDQNCEWPNESDWSKLWINRVGRSYEWMKLWMTKWIGLIENWGMSKWKLEWVNESLEWFDSRSARVYQNVKCTMRTYWLYVGMYLHIQHRPPL